MQRILLSLLLFFVEGVSGADETEPVSVMEGDSVTLHTNLSEILNDDTILWMFGPKDFVISQITRKGDLTSFYVTDDDERFRGRLLVDQNTGSLTIRNTRIKHSGQYKLSISRQKTTTKIFNVTVFDTVGKMDAVKSVSVTEGESVTLQTDVTETQRDDLIVWRFGDEGKLIAKIDVETNKTNLYDADERFRDRLKLDQTGSLTIKSTKTEDSGLYEVQIRGRESSQRFLLSVSAVPYLDLSPGVIAGIVVAALLVLFAVVIYSNCRISKLKEQVVEETKIPVNEGDSPILHTVTVHEDDQIQWYYEDETNLIAEINKTNMQSTRDGADGRFSSKLRLDDNGDLIISNIRTIHSGLYILKISNSRRTKYKRFILTVSVNSVSAKEEDPARLNTDAEIQKDDVILWTFGAENRLVAIDSRATDIDERFKDRVELDEKTGSLIIKNIRTTDSGHFKLQIINSEQTTFKRFNVTVTGKQANEKTTSMTQVEQ